MTTNVSLPPALERFARGCVAEGRYSNGSEVVRSGLRLLQATSARTISVLVGGGIPVRHRL
ncbi:MAG TPA: type II toxin-antitoxin system ParD family antitoxin [Stellaceae bacterium]